MPRVGADVPNRDADGEEESAALRHSFLRGIAWTGGAKWSAQLLTWVSTIVVARLLTPDDYGLVQMAMVFLSFVALMNEFGIGAAIVILRDLTSRQLATLNGLALGLGFASVAVAGAAAVPLGRFFDAEPLPVLVVVLSFAFLVTALRTVPQALLQKELRFKLLGGIEALQALSNAATTVALAWVGFGYWALAAGRLVGASLWTALVLVFRRHPVSRPRVAPVRRALRFSAEIFLAHLAWYVYSSTHFVFAGKLLGASALGVYSFAWTLASISIDRITALLTGVLPSYFSILTRDRATLRTYFLNITEALALIIFPITWGTALVADAFVPVVLGDKWTEAIPPLQILPFYAAFFAIASIPPQVLRVVGEARFMMFANIGIAVFLQPALLFGIQWGTLGLSIVWVTAYPLLTLPIYWRTFVRIELRLGAYLRALWPATSAGLVMIAAVMAARALSPANWPAAARLSVMVAVGAASYAAVVLTLHRGRVDEFRALVRETREAGGSDASAGPA